MQNKYIEASQARDFKMLDDRISGKTLEQIAKNNGVTRERVRQILYKMSRKAKLYDACKARLSAAVLEIKIKNVAPFTKATLCKDLHLSIRAFNVIEASFTDVTVEEMAKITDHQVLSAPNCGRKTLKEIRDAVNEVMQK